MTTALSPLKEADALPAQPHLFNRERLHHETNTLFQRPDRLHEPLYIITPVINATRSRRRWQLYQDFRAHVANAGAILITVEVAFGDRDFAVTTADDPNDVQLRTWHELWHKERAINVGAMHLTRMHPCWKKLAWIDADTLFVRPDWANEILHVLEHYPVIQCWSELANVSVEYELKSWLRSFLSIQMEHPGHCGDYYAYDGQKFGSPGLAWAARREAFEQMGGLLDVCVLGAGDWYLAMALMGMLDEAIRQRNDLSGPFVRRMLLYQENLRRSWWHERSIVGNVGLMRGMTIHYFHGSRADRQYKTRGEILMRHEFDPDRDLKCGSSGLYQLTDRCPQLRRDIQAYFGGLNSDALS